MPTCRMSPRVARLLEGPPSPVLEDHLAGCPECQRALDEAAGPLRLPPAAPGGDDPAPSLLDRLRGLPHGPAPEEPPPVIPGFEVLGVIGRGGSAVVYKARQVALDRLVALKVLTPEYAAQPDGLARARRGVELLASMDHPNIVRVLHGGTHEGVYYAALEYATYGSLAEYLEGWTLLPKAAARQLKSLAGAVQAMHDRGVLHRDLKSANVLFDYRGPGDVVPKLADFGLVRLIDGAEELTGTGVIVGTPGAMSPEQAQGRRRLGPAVDVWGLGVILYEMLTGRPPFDAESTTELLGRAAHDAPEPPGRLAVGVPPDLEHVCLTCLRKDPRDRYPSAAALADDLSAFLAGEPLPSRAVTWEGRVRSFAKRHGAALAALAAALWLLAVLFAWHGAESSLGRSERELHHLRLDLARDRLERGDRAGAWEVLERCAHRRRDAEWERLWDRCQPRGE